MPRNVDAATGLAVCRSGLDNHQVLRRYLYRTTDGTLRRGRLAVLLVVAIGLAIFGTALIVLAPHVSDSTFGRGMWVMFVVVALKFPLIAILWSFIRRNAEWPGRRIEWSERELAAILARLANEAGVAGADVHGEARLTHLSREAWHIADQVSGDAKVDALTVALGIDERLMIRRARRSAG